MLLTYREGYYPEAETQPEVVPASDELDDLTDEQVAEAYGINVGGNATSRRGQVKALRALDADGDNPEQ